MLSTGQAAIVASDPSIFNVSITAGTVTIIEPTIREFSLSEKQELIEQALGLRPIFTPEDYAGLATGTLTTKEVLEKNGISLETLNAVNETETAKAIIGAVCGKAVTFKSIAADSLRVLKGGSGPPPPPPPPLVYSGPPRESNAVILARKRGNAERAANALIANLTADFLGLSKQFWYRLKSGLMVGGAAGIAYGTVLMSKSIYDENTTTWSGWAGFAGGFTNASIGAIMAIGGAGATIAGGLISIASTASTAASNITAESENLRELLIEIHSFRKLPKAAFEQIEEDYKNIV